MKKTMLVVSLVCAFSAYGAEPTIDLSKVNKPPKEESLFNSGLFIDLYGGTSTPEVRFAETTYSAGVGVGYFFNQNFGLEAKVATGDVTSQQGVFLDEYSGEVIGRIPVSKHLALGGYCSGGYSVAQQIGFGGAGVLAEYKFNKNIGLYAQFGPTITCAGNGGLSGEGGFRFSFK